MTEINKNEKLLRKKSKKVKKINNDINDLVLEMSKAMEENDGIGLAACQIGEFKRVFIIRKEEGFDVFINPAILKKSKEKIEIEEGCLSVPNCLIKIKRPKEVKIKALNLKGEEIILNLKGIEARVFQHELDHLNGILIKDRIPFIKKIKNCLLR